MNKKVKIISAIVFLAAVASVIAWYFHHTNVPVLEPAGTIGQKQKDLIVFALGLSLIVVIPVYALLFSFAWRYREGNSKRHKYSPELTGNRWAEAVWWLIPTVLIIILSVVTWDSSHTLDPYRQIASKTAPLRIQVIAMDWKWLFIYPDQHIASVNFFQFPVNTPLDFQITSDAPMNSFWIPQLGGQIYAMPGMMTQLHLIADRAGSYNGSSANISGDGFAQMTFVARASSQADYAAWLHHARQSSEHLDTTNYNRLATPGESQVRSYSAVQDGLFQTEVFKYMVPTSAPGSPYNSNGGSNG
ncbi:MAG TPA: ubiquinol oxidase subunit II [Candidatus Saccharimonadales bacterium]|nr:ubiquinol oxidase subunit II [Candidatus Saccharimonadales bacterium]